MEMKWIAIGVIGFVFAISMSQGVKYYAEAQVEIATIQAQSCQEGN